MSGDHPVPAMLEYARPRTPVDLMNWPWFSLAKTPRTAPILYQGKKHSVYVAPMAGATAIATIWDADILIWAIAQLVQAQDERLHISTRLIAPASRILGFLGRGTGSSQYARLTAAIDRLAATVVETTLGTTDNAPIRFRWIEAWEMTPAGVLLTLPEWLLMAVRQRRVLSIDPDYFGLTGGIRRWLWLLARKHAAQQSTGWVVSFDLLHARSGSVARHCDFVAALRRLARSGRLLTYRLDPVWHRGKEGVRIGRYAVPIHSAALVPGDNPGFLSPNRGDRL
ncbi:replication initiator protein A [Acidiphilium sp. PM]|uniref:replication initiator protein A n=1 Tax=Acidiphilium sp. PM TaxID=1043206 RepID=UPI00021445B5|nr:replication initiator protein A [Acidiphilium sp. PM]EGO93789.1 Replication protein A [Acidiphilium sp. PM]